MRVLHLIDSAADWPALHAAATLHAKAPADHRIAIFGAPRLADLAAEWNLPFDRLPHRASHGTLRRYLKHRPDTRLIHAWSMPSADRAARSATPLPLLLTLWQRPCRPNWLQHRRWRQAVERCRSITVSNASLIDEYARHRVTLNAPSVVPFPIEAARFDPSRRKNFRDDWGLTDATTVIAAIGDPAASSDARMIGYQAGVLSIAGRSTAAIVHPLARDVERARRFRGHHRDREWEIVTEDRPIWEWLPACDACVWTDDPGLRAGSPLRRMPPSPLALAWVAAAGIPIITEDVPATRDLLPSDAACFVTPGNRLELNRALLRVIDDHAHRTAITAVAKSAVANHTPAAFIAAMQPLYATATA